jgi:Flp pilus assembly protein TadG
MRMPFRLRSPTQLLRARDGSTAVELAFVAGPFLALIFAILEMGFSYLLMTSLDRGTAAAARQIRTGQIKTGGQKQFEDVICQGALNWVGEANCRDNLGVSVRVFPTWGQVTAENPVANKVYTKPTRFETGDANSIIVVQTFYMHKLFVPQMNPAMERVGGGNILLQSAASFRNEPWIAGQSWNGS